MICTISWVVVTSTRIRGVEQPATLLGYPVIETPTLMIWGEDDIALTKETTYGTAEHVRDFRIRYLPRVSHWVQQEAPEAVNAMIRAFLTGRSVPEIKWVMQLEETAQ